jgi:hypothetical protein
LLFFKRLGEFERCLLKSVSVANIPAVANPSGINHVASDARKPVGLVQIALWSSRKCFKKFVPIAFSWSASFGKGSRAVREIDSESVALVATAAFCGSPEHAGLIAPRDKSIRQKTKSSALLEVISDLVNISER